MELLDNYQLALPVHLSSPEICKRITRGAFSSAWTMHDKPGNLHMDDGTEHAWPQFCDMSEVVSMKEVDTLTSS